MIKGNQKPDSKNRKAISVKTETYDRLLQYGTKKDSFDQILNQILDAHEMRLNLRLNVLTDKTEPKDPVLWKNNVILFRGPTQPF